MARQDAEELKQAISNAFSLFGIPKLLVADRGRMFEARSFVSWLSEMGCDIHHITPEMHQSNGQVERYVRTLLNMIRIQAESNHATWSGALWRLQLVLNITKQKTTQTSPLNLLVGIDGATPVIRSLVRDVAADVTRPNREAWREMCRTRANELLRRNRTQQDTYVNQKRRPARVFQVGDFVFVIKYSQSTRKLDPGIEDHIGCSGRCCGRYELKLLGGSWEVHASGGRVYGALARGVVPGGVRCFLR
ncbi:integrase core domain-containing protein [Phthorimaea operculella]|nr:integrase core domain-containing protein [Phthorimaea operculella]